MAPSTVKIAACHTSPAYLNPRATVPKILAQIDSAAAAGAHLVVFPEAYLPGFPIFASVSAPVDTAAQFEAYVKASVYADGSEIAEVRAKAKERGVVVSLGFSERSRNSEGCVWNSNLVVGEGGEVLAHHRKLVPTFWEKLVWSPGDGHGLLVNDTKTCGRVGALICGENTNPLARYSLIAQSEQIHIMAFPPLWPTTRSTASNYDNKTANAVRAAGHSFEAKCFTVVCAGYFSTEMRDALLEAAGDDKEGIRRKEREEVLKAASQARTQFFGPDGAAVGEERSDEEGIAYAEVQLEKCVGGKRLHDISGGYQRYDVFDLKVNRKRDEPVTFV